MNFEQLTTVLAKGVPWALLLGLVADWLRLRAAHRSEEKKHIGRAISDLLQLRYLALGLTELPKLAVTMFPKELRRELPDDFWRHFDFSPLLTADEGLPMRYQKAVDEIAGFRPLLAFQLRDKERYFDLRKVVSNHFAQSPGSPLVASKMTEMLDMELVSAIDKTLALLAKAHGIPMRFSVALACRRRSIPKDMIPPAMKRTFQDTVRQIVAASNADLSKEPSQPS